LAAACAIEDDHKAGSSISAHLAAREASHAGHLLEEALAAAKAISHGVSKSISGAKSRLVPIPVATANAGP
jgi:hypothetical protein